MKPSFLPTCFLMVTSISVYIRFIGFFQNVLKWQITLSYKPVRSIYVHKCTLLYFSCAILMKCLGQIISLLPDIFKSGGQWLFLNFRELS